MKKPIIILILFLVTISAFAEDKLSYAKNLSLVKVSDANNRMFFDPNVFLPSNLPNYAEKNRNSRQHQTFSIPELQRYSEQNSILKVNAFTNIERNSGNMYSLRFGQQKEISSEQTKSSLAEEYLRRLARTSKKQRKVGATGGFIVGGICVAAGLAMISSDEDEENFFAGFGSLFGTIYIVSGVGCIAGGAYLLAIPSAAERELDDVLGVSDAARRERACEDALASLARRGRRSRVVGGILSATISGISLTQKDSSLEPVVMFGAIAVYEFLRKSRAERTYQNYLKEKERQKEFPHFRGS